MNDKKTFEAASAELSNAVYKATALFEQLEAEGLIIGDAHHARQKLATAAVEDLRQRWNGRQ